ncbi:Pantothenate synthetase [Saezia sanguinis]|uniref:Pantothenate synthetase n=1 Tax=Saezia sanguinis TaxID=1965230 RepID=A0A433SFK7_9BURK|nr:pantoate--beta-alanine ligase [Saezia sanguinis]RUS67549.1 Pantothenate synthetase [Saezia sanguinis]
MIQITSTVAEVQNQVRQWKQDGLTVALVPTMGYLHEGHGSLIAQAAKENDRVVVSIFVNPMQFGPAEDLATYPRDLVRDQQVCSQYGAHLIFHPTVEEMYTPGFSSYVDVSGLTEGLCGSSRPGHFRGVCTVVNKLLHIVAPHKAYFGQKDAQQLAVIRRMVRDLNMDPDIVGCPIVREPDGLAKSSRNTYLSAQERAAALCLSQALDLGRNMAAHGERDAAAIIEAVGARIRQEPLAKIDYVHIVDLDTLKPVQQIDRPVLCALAVFIGKTRLIDNFIFTP